VFADMPDWTNAVVRLPYPNWDSQARPATQVVAARSPEPPTFHVKRWVRRTYRFPLVAHRQQEPSADCLDRPEWANAHVYVLRSSPTLRESRAPGVRRCRTLLPTAVLPGGFVSDFRLLQRSRRIELALAHTQHREEGGIWSRTRGDHVAVPSMAAVCPTPVGLE
jgi:hypothetical protein